MCALEGIFLCLNTNGILDVSHPSNGIGHLVLASNNSWGKTQLSKFSFHFNDEKKGCN